MLAGRIDGYRRSIPQPGEIIDAEDVRGRRLRDERVCETRGRDNNGTDQQVTQLHFQILRYHNNFAC
jgi:hypothetical protein